jgi:uncharacterized membrane protein
LQHIEMAHPSRIGHQRGAAAAIFVVMLSVALAAGAFALDFGHLLLVRNELQNAADAAALAGAGALHGGAPEANKPNWTQGEITSTGVTRLNASDGAALTHASIEPGSGT